MSDNIPNPKLKVLKSILEMKTYRENLEDQSVGFIPTMGSLHEGHLELIKNSLRKNQITIVSIFVNPMQFNNENDFNTYPNQISSDLELLESLNVDAVFMPTKEQIYPSGYDFKISESKDSIGLCGSARPGHFDGVLTVLLKLFNLVKPKNVYMGLKDYQQYLLVKNMTEDLFMDIKIEGVETVREHSGLAMSSRNLNLNQEQKIIADNYAKIFTKDEPLDVIKAKLETLDLEIDYLTERWGRKFVAVFIGKVRLIDNRPYSFAEKNLNDSVSNSNAFSIAKTQNVLNSDSINFSSDSKLEISDISPKNILFKMSGSIACYKACDVISKLVQLGYNVKIAVTPDTFNFVGRATLEGLSQNVLISDLYSSGQMMEHIHLNDWSDITVLCPATANTISKISIGMSDNIVTALALSRVSAKPYLMMPAMNTRMLDNKFTHEALKKIEESGIQVLQGKSGSLACGHTGTGRLAEPKEILELILNTLKNMNSVKANSKANSKADLKTKSKTESKTKILVTAGGTSEPIDPVRTVTNISTGQTGLRISQLLSSKYDVTLLGSNILKNEIKNLNSEIKFIGFSSFNELEKNLKSLLGSEEYNAIVHLAAVSDYSPSVLSLSDRLINLPSLEKLSLDQEDSSLKSDSVDNNLNHSEEFSIKFKKNKKLISEIRTYSKNKEIKIIGFKLLRTDDLEKIQFEIDKILKSSDFVVVNDLNNISSSEHIYEIHNREGLVFHGQSKNDMSSDILKIIEGSQIL